MGHCLHSKRPFQVIIIVFSFVDIIKHLNTGITDCVLPVDGWDYTAHFTGDTLVREVFALHNDFGVVKCVDDGTGTKRAF